MSKKSFHFSLLVVFSLFLYSCGSSSDGSSSDPTPSPVDFAGLLPDLVASCSQSSCHDSSPGLSTISLLTQADFDSNAAEIQSRINQTIGSTGRMPNDAGGTFSGSYVPDSGSTRTAAEVESDLKAYIAWVLSN
jgi:hypothetical protein